MDDLKEVIEQLSRLSSLVPAPKLEAPFAPPAWPRTEMEVMFRLLAEEAGLPQRCPDRACQRAKCCRGNPGGAHACAALWTEADLNSLHTAYLALVLAWMNEAKRLYERADMLIPPEEFSDFDLPLEANEAATPQLRR